jgi:Fe-S oxidoreductase
MPVVGLEPSCVAVFRDELINLFPHDENAKRLSQQTFLLSEFLEKKVKEYQPPKLQRKAVVHGRCHHKAIMKLKDEEALLTKLGLDYQTLDSGCCGMAGAFGFEKDHYAISMRIGERVLLPAVRQADQETLIIADGFSCREQIEQSTDRHTLHLAQVLQMALHEGQDESTGKGDEENAEQTKQSSPLLLSAVLALLGVVLLWIWKQRR